MKLVLDAGALLALERNDRPMWRRFKGALLEGSVPATHGGVVGQVWRGRGPRQALLAKALIGVEVRPLDLTLGRRAGELLGAAHRADVIDAALVLLADDDDQIITSDPRDLAPLATASGRHIEIVRT
jgi:hypothetical protein